MAVKEYQTIEAYEIDSPVMERIVASGRARCRICGQKIAKGLDCWDFFHNFQDAGYSAWTAVECKAHSACLPDQKPY